ncbi:MAG: TrmH family RNA methyltransferase [Oscillospiraceae bacterium]
MELVTSRQNSVIRHVKKLSADRKYRRNSGEFLCEGPKMLSEAERWGFIPRTILACSEPELQPWEGRAARTVLVSPELLSYAADTETPQGLLFTCELPEEPEKLPGQRLLVLDGVQDPGNVGTIWRTADAFGADGLILLPGCADPWAPKVVRATMGACFRLPIWSCTLDELTEKLREENIPLYATALREDTQDIRSADLKKAAVVIGSEGRGVSGRVLEACELTLKIPMRERCESLNAAMAAGIVLWESWR